MNGTHGNQLSLSAQNANQHIGTKTRKGTGCDVEFYTEYFCKTRNKKRYKWAKYNNVKCSVCGKIKLKLLSTIKKHNRNYCSEECRSKAIKSFYSGEDHMSYTSGKYIHDGYVHIKKPGHHRADLNGYVPEHILVAEEKTGRKIKKTEHVHHDNENRSDNSPENLIVMTVSEHRRLHAIKTKFYELSPMYQKHLANKGGINA